MQLPFVLNYPMAVLAAFIVFGAGCSSRSTSDGPPPAERSTAAIGGANVLDASGSRAEDLATPYGIAGTVGALVLKNSSTGFTHFLACSATLVARDTVLTSKSCVTQVDPSTGLAELIPVSMLSYLAEVDLEFPEWGEPYEVATVWTSAPTEGPYVGFAILKLNRPVPREVVRNVAPVYFGDVSRLLGQTALIAGYGVSGDGGEDPSGFRRIGEITSPIVLTPVSGYSPTLQATVDSALDAVPWPWVDNGGPLFLFDPQSRRYVLAGISGINMRPRPPGTSSSVMWSYLGNPGNGVVKHNHAPLLLPHLGPDRDRDGVPDASDNCSPAMCEAHGLDPSLCYNPDQADINGDLLGDACCFVDPRASMRNSNNQAEDASGATARPDLCDPVPLVRIQTRFSALETVPGVEPTRISFRGESWLGSGVDVSGVEANIAFRYCGCYHFDGSALSEEFCSQVCRADRAVDAGGGFVAIDTEWEPNLFQREVIPGSGGLPQPFVAGRQGPNRNFGWEWYDDAVRGHIQTHERKGKIPVGSQGFLASAVVKDGTFFSERDLRSLGNLRAVLNFRSFPHEVKLQVGPMIPPLGIELAPCRYDPFGCNGRFLWPWELWLERISGVPDLVDEPLLVGFDKDNGYSPFAIASWDGPYRINFGEALDDMTAWAPPGGGEAPIWVSPVEPLAYLRQQNTAVRAIHLPDSDSFADGVQVVVADTNGLSVQARGLAGIMALAAGPLAGSNPNNYKVRMPEGGRALFSASRQSVLLVGGATLDPQARVRRYGIDSQKLEILSVDGNLHPSDLVLGAAFDYLTDKLYVLDVHDEKARLVAHDLQGGTSRRLWESSYNELYSSTFLGQTDDGNLVLVVTDGSSYTAWSIDVSGESAVFSGRMDGEGSPVVAPVMGRHALIMPLLDADGIRYVELAAGRFQRGEGCTGL